MSLPMANFDDEINGYLKARIASEHKERHETDATNAANAAADDIFGHGHHSQSHGQSQDQGPSFPYPHPEGYHPTTDAPAFAQHPMTQFWHDANTGTFSYYDAASETYIPVEGHDALQGSYQQQQQQQQQQYPTSTARSSPATSYHIDPYTGYQVEMTNYGDQGHQGHYEAPPESDAMLRLCVLSSNVIQAGGVILMDASGLSFGRDRPLSGQGKRVRMVEMEISRFHASIYLDRQEIPQEGAHFEQRQQGAQQADQNSWSGAAVTTAMGEVVEPKNHDDAPTSTSQPMDATLEQESVISDGSEKDSIAIDAAKETISDAPAAIQTAVDTEDRTEDQDQEQDREDGELPDSPSAGAQDPGQEEQGNEDEKTIEQQRKQYDDYQRQLEEYHRYYASSVMPPVIVDTFQIIDCGSTHGTFLNEQRLSDPKTASQPFPLKHLDRLQMGSTVFEIHAHEEGRICATCQVTEDNEIGVLDDKERDTGSKTEGLTAKSSPLLAGDLKWTKEQERIEEMNRLRKKWAGPEKKAGTRRSGNGDSGMFSSSPSSTSTSMTTGNQPREYVDRAAKRRLLNPDHSRPAPSVTPAYGSEEVTAATGYHVPVARTNKGHAMLSKMGWKAGTGLGAARQGVVEPVQLMVTDKKAGLGSGNLQSQGAAAMTAARPPETAGEAARRRARERFAQLK
ncbi:hypothetical protein BG011_010179 [Mortierella polycephala]|uniref:G-patch domain-containing protein n=1 Tax=Mortierella polycephala TaxID=41804 RepID=A0A9P6PN45_9FUNG|nr:hypothetical protein BG011_010179 [Mortierella polycephala]